MSFTADCFCSSVSLHCWPPGGHNNFGRIFRHKKPRLISGRPILCLGNLSRIISIDQLHCAVRLRANVQFGEMAILRQHCIAVHLKVGPSVMRSISVHSKEGGGPSHLYSPDGEFSSLSVGRVLGSPGESRGSGIGYRGPPATMRG